MDLAALVVVALGFFDEKACGFDVGLLHVGDEQLVVDAFAVDQVFELAAEEEFFQMK